MRAIPLVVFLAVPLVAQVESNIGCVERLELPQYPPLGKQARIWGTVATTVQLGADGSIEKIAFEPTGTKNHVLQAGVEESLRKASLAKNCAGKQITFVFNFELRAEGYPQTTFSFGFPNQFWIIAPETKFQP